MTCGRRTAGLLTVIAVVIVVCGSQTASAATPSGKKVTRTVRALSEKYPLRSTLFGVWKNGRRLASGALGESRPGVPATRADHFRIGNVTESLTTTLLLQLVDEGRVASTTRSRTGSRTCPALNRSRSGCSPEASRAMPTTSPPRSSRSCRTPTRFGAGGSPSWSSSPSAARRFARHELGILRHQLRALGKVLRRVGGRPVPQLLERRILSELGLHETRMRVDARISKPIMHGYTRDHGRYVDATRWSISWARYTGNTTSTLGDMGRWATALGTGSLLSRQSHALQIGPQNVGLGPLTANDYYAMGTAVTNGWIVTNPQLDGYNGVVSYLPAKREAVVVFTTQGPRGKPSSAYASAVYNRIGRLLAPNHPPSLQVCPRPPC